MDENKSSTAAAAAAMGGGGGGGGEMNKVFNRFDEDGDGKISAAELGKVVRALGSEVSEREVEVMIQEMDSDRDGFVDRKEFAEFNKSSGSGGGSGGGKGKRLEGELRGAFDMYDLNKNGVVSAKELHLVLQKLGEKCRVEDCCRMIKSVDSDGDGCVNFEEFKMMMSGGLKKKKEQS